MRSTRLPLSSVVRICCVSGVVDFFGNLQVEQIKLLLCRVRRRVAEVDDALLRVGNHLPVGILHDGLFCKLCHLAAVLNNMAQSLAAHHLQGDPQL